MGTLFFCFVLLLLAAYVVLDGYDLGTGVLHVHLAREDAERRQLLSTIGPLWDGNEVFLIAAGGTLFFAFPELYAVSFSGFYLPLMVVLWLLILRGVSIEVRDHFRDPLWRQLFDVGFFVSSVLLAFFLGVGLGNVVRGVPVGPPSHRMFLQPFWTSFVPGQQNGILDWYTVLVGATALAVLSTQGALWIAFRTVGSPQERAIRLGKRLWGLSAVLVAGMSAATFEVQPRVVETMGREPWRLIFPILGALAFVGTPLLGRRRQWRLAFGAWSGFLAMLLCSAAFGLYPWVLPSSLDRAYSLTVEQAQAADASLRIGAIWWPIGVGLAIGYTAYAHWRFSGKTVPQSEGDEKGTPRV